MRAAFLSMTPDPAPGPPHPGQSNFRQGHPAQVAFAVDDLASVDPWRVRCLEIRGHADAIAAPADSSAGIDGPIIRIHPRRIISFGIDDPDHGPHELVPNNRDVTD
jgi:hypothetical protein